MKRIFLALMISAGLFTACDDDEIVEVKDYGLKTFEANLAFNSEAAYGEVAYTQQVYFDFEEENAVAFGNYGADTWTDFNIIEDTTAYKVQPDNISSDWDLVFTNYTTRLMMGPTSYMDYGVTGVLINLEENIQVAMLEDTISSDLSAAFAALTLNDISDLSYTTNVDAIGYNWKKTDANYTYIVNDNYFYFVRKEEDTYKIRFTSFYGSSAEERLIKMEYQLMQ